MRTLTDEELVEALTLYFHTMWGNLAKHGYQDKELDAESMEMGNVLWSFLTSYPDDDPDYNPYGIKLESREQFAAINIARLYQCGACGIDRLLRPRNKGERCSKCPCKWDIPEGSIIDDGDARCEYHSSEYCQWVLFPQRKKARRVLHTWSKRQLAKWMKEYKESKAELAGQVAEYHFIGKLKGILDAEWNNIYMLTEKQVITWLVEGFGATIEQAQKAVDGWGFAEGEG